MSEEETGWQYKGLVILLGRNPGGPQMQISLQPVKNPFWDLMPDQICLLQGAVKKMQLVLFPFCLGSHEAGSQI